MRVLSLFDGLGGARRAIHDLGIYPDKYVASEIDKHAIKVAQKNHPDIIHIGDVNDINYNVEKLYGPFDLIIGGSPCQDLSVANNNRKGLSGSRSSLFWKMANIIEEFHPRYFLLENVASMSKENKQIITDVLGVEPILINSALLTAQNRKRLYWTNIKGIQQPEDKNIYLKDILEKGHTERLKSLCITSTYSRACLQDYFYKSNRQLVFNKPVRLYNIGKGSQGQRVYSIEGKSVCLSSAGGGQGAKTGLYLTEYHKSHFDQIKNSKDPLIVSERGRRLTPDGKKRDDKNGIVYRGLEVCSSTKSNCLSTVQKDNLLAFKKIIRKLSPIECERLQGLEDNYTKENGVSDTQRYKMIGNGFTIPVIAYILSFMKPIRRDKE
jgi:DNA (cytosine-5)-methyltransferase 3A